MSRRFYDPTIGRFIQPDTVVPSGVQGYDRYAYVGNDPINRTDPTGHRTCTDDGYCPGMPNPHSTGAPSVPAGVPTAPSPSATPAAPPLSKPVAPSTPGPAAGLQAQKACTTPSPNGVRNCYNPVNWPDSSAEELDAVSNGLDFAEQMHWVHVPIVGIFIDGKVQLDEDYGDGYTFGQESARVIIHVAEGQVSSTVGAAVAGTGSIPGAITGPGDILIVGGSYIAANTIVSKGFDLFNTWVVSKRPDWKDYVP